MEASQAEKNVFGADVKLHPVTLRPIETGSGALPVEEQALLHLRDIEHEQGEAAADAMRKKMGIPTRADLEEQAKAEAAATRKEDERVAKALALLDQHEAELAKGEK